MVEQEQLAAQFEEHRPRLRSLAYRMLGSLADVDDAVQETWLRASRDGADDVENFGGWLTTIASRVCLNMLRTRDIRRETPPLSEEPDTQVHVPDPLIGAAEHGGPEDAAVLSDSVSLALMVVLDKLSPAERLAFVLHDMFAVPFEEIAPMIDKSPAATRQLASRSRRRVRDEAPAPDPDVSKQRAVVDAFLAAAREGDFNALVSVLDPAVVLRSDGGLARPRYTVELRGTETIAAQATLAKQLAPFARPAIVNGTAGVVTIAGGRVLSVMTFTVVNDKVVTIEVLNDPDRLAALDVSPVADVDAE